MQDFAKFHFHPALYIQFGTQYRLKHRHLAILCLNHPPNKKIWFNMNTQILSCYGLTYLLMHWMQRRSLNILNDYG